MSSAPDILAPGQEHSPSPDLLCFSHLRWHFVTQRPQHLLLRAARERRVFYWEEPVWHGAGELPLRKDGSLGMHLDVLQEGPSLYVLQPHITFGVDFEQGQRTLLEEFVERFNVREPIRWYYTPMAFDFSADVPAGAIVYDCMDELKNFLNPPPGLAEREQRLLHAADVVFTGGISLYEAKRNEHPNVHPFPSSIDVPHFAQAAGGSLPDPADQAGIPHPRAGFYGVVDERFDIELLREVAALRPEIHFVILGPVVKIDAATLPQGENIHYLGGKGYEHLPAYLSGWDVALLPFALNDATRFISRLRPSSSRRPSMPLCSPSPRRGAGL